MVVATEIFNKIIDSLSTKPMSIYQICYATKLDPRTIRKHLSIIERIQESEKIKKEVIGARVYFRK